MLKSMPGFIQNTARQVHLLNNIPYNKMDQYDQLRLTSYNANMQLFHSGLVMFNFGNVSASDPKSGVFAIKPSGVPYEDLTPEMIVIVDFDGNTVDGKLRPSSDTLTHAVLYKNWPEIGGIAHTHSCYATSWAQSQRDINIYGTTHADHLPCDIPCTSPMPDNSIKGNYEYETGIQILECMQKKGFRYQEVEMMLVGSHGTFTWGKTAEKAVYNSAILEDLAKMALLTEQINPKVKRLKDTIIQKHYERKHGKNSYYGQS